MNWLTIGVAGILIYLCSLIFIEVKQLYHKSKFILYCALASALIYRILQSYLQDSSDPIVSAVMGVAGGFLSSFVAVRFTRFRLTYRDSMAFNIAGLFLGIRFTLAVLFIVLCLLLVTQAVNKYITKRNLPTHFNYLLMVTGTIIVALVPSLKTDDSLATQLLLSPLVIIVIRLFTSNPYKELDTLIKAGEYQNALSLLRHMLPQKRKDWRINSEMGYVLIKLGQSNQAFEYLDRALKLNPSAASPLAYKSLALNSLDRFEEAVSYSDKALKIEPDNLIALETKSASCLMLDQFEPALEAANSLLEFSPKTPMALEVKATLLLKLHRYEEAIEIFNNLIEARDQTYELLMHLVECHQALGNKTLALEALGKVKGLIEEKLAEQPRNDNLFNTMGYVFIIAGRFTEAIEYIDQALALNSRNDAALNNKSWALYSLGQFNEALEYAKQAVTENSRNYLHWVNKGNAHLSLKQAMEALDSFTKALELNPNSIQALWGKGLMLFDLGDYTRAIEFFSKYLSLKGEDSDKALAHIGECFKLLGNYQESLRFYNLAIEKNPKDAFLWYYQGNVYYLKGDKFQAMECLQSCINLDPDFTSAYYNLSKIQAEQGMTIEALSNLKIAVYNDNRYLELATREHSFTDLHDLKEFKEIMGLGDSGDTEKVTFH